MAFNHKKSISLRITQAARAQRTYSAKLLSEIGLHPGQETVLKSLNKEDGQSMSELASELGVRPPTVTKMINRLSAQGYVERRASKTDGRQSHVYLSAAGIALLSDIDKAWKSLEKASMKGIEDKDRKMIRKLLKQIERNLNAGPLDDMDDND
ncbi:MAG: MarR family winged helix-turn-helix transcriptional regulator [Hyphomicrobiales bacterium]